MLYPSQDELETPDLIKKNPHQLLDDLKLSLSQATLRLADVTTIRSKSVANLQRWRERGTWGPAYDEWLDLMLHASDDHILQIMTGEDERANRLRQSFPYVGIVEEETRLKLVAEYQYALEKEYEFRGVK